MEKIKLTDIRGIKSPDHITFRVNRKDLKHFPDVFFADVTIDEMRDGTQRKDKMRRRR